MLFITRKEGSQHKKSKEFDFFYGGWESAGIPDGEEVGAFGGIRDMDAMLGAMIRRSRG
jgi:hypothetical protein